MSRPKGQPNKITARVRKTIANFIEGKTEAINDLWKMLSPKEKIMLYTKLLPYAIPKYSEEQFVFHNDDENRDYNQLTVDELRTLLALIEKAEIKPPKD